MPENIKYSLRSRSALSTASLTGCNVPPGVNDGAGAWFLMFSGTGDAIPSFCFSCAALKSDEGRLFTGVLLSPRFMGYYPEEAGVFVKAVSGMSLLLRARFQTVPVGNPLL